MGLGDDDEMEFDGEVVRGKRHPLVPPLNLPKNAVEDWRQKLLHEKLKKEKPPLMTPSDQCSLSDIQSENRDEIHV